MDDEEVVRKLLTRMLPKLGFDVVCVGDGTAVLEAYQQAAAQARPFDVVIMDLTIPGGMGGKEAIQQLRAIDPQVKAIVSSGYSEDPVMADHTAHGFCGVVAKPYTPEQFKSVLDEILET